MTSLRLLLIGIIISLSACAYMPEKHFVPVSNETMTQWQVEGSIKIKDRNTRAHSYFMFQQIDDDYEIDILNNDPVGQPLAVISGSEASDDFNEKIVATNRKAEETAKVLHKSFFANDLSYWVRGLAATEDAQVKFGKDDHVSQIKDKGWTIKYKEFMEVGEHLLPQKMELSKGKTDVEIDLVRAETGFVASPCEGFDESKVKDTVSKTSDLSSKEFIEKIVPANGKPPVPRWIDQDAFCTQLVKVHGKIPDPRAGLYGPDSMMWKLVGMLAPAGAGAGRALLLQTAHPWVTQGIDEHSIVRYDPIERARITFTGVSTLVFGSMPQAMAAAHHVHQSHNQIHGEMQVDAGAFKKHSEYRANEVNAMIWVQATLWDTIVTMYEQIYGPLSGAEKERFYQESKLFAMMFGIPEDALPRDWNEFQAYCRSMWDSPQLTVTENTRKLKDDLFTPDSMVLAGPLWMQEILTAGSLPPRIRDGYGMEFGTWRRFNYNFMMTGAKVTFWLLPKPWEYHSVYHEAMARMKGKRVGAYHRRIIRSALGTERLVN